MEGYAVVMNAQGMELTEPVRAGVEDSLRADMEPFARRIVVAHVRLWVAPNGEGPAVCHVRVDLRPTGGVALGETGPDVRTAAARAGRRLSAALAAPFPGRRPASHAWLR